MCWFQRSAALTSPFIHQAWQIRTQFYRTNHKNYVSTILTNKSKNASEQDYQSHPRLYSSYVVAAAAASMRTRTQTWHARQTTTGHTKTSSSSHMESVTKYMLHLLLVTAVSFKADPQLYTMCPEFLTLLERLSRSHGGQSVIVGIIDILKWCPWSCNFILRNKKLQGAIRQMKMMEHHKHTSSG